MSDTVLARLAIAGHNQFNEALSAVEVRGPHALIRADAGRGRGAVNPHIALRRSTSLRTRFGPPSSRPMCVCTQLASAAGGSRLRAAPQAALFAARAAYRQGKSMTAQLEAERKGYGVQIAWYRTAMGCCEDAVAAGQRGGPITAEGSLPRATAFLSVCKEVLEVRWGRGAGFTVCGEEGWEGGAQRTALSWGHASRVGQASDPPQTRPPAGKASSSAAPSSGRCAHTPLPGARRQDVERDNRLIYMEAPAQVDVRSISPAMMAKDAPLPVGSISDPDADLFARLEEVRSAPRAPLRPRDLTPVAGGEERFELLHPVTAPISRVGKRPCTRAWAVPARWGASCNTATPLEKG